ncbi:sensor domain-containing protein [Natronosalvus caseinilyticus]|uniref:sensor domain-containing protein n=1 Tax=Natronosalvus caseinilyticus TaxID=2953747 RepID=UPI0028A719F0|nr:sensor domain-containing protein [Natronosalvus caseinilyticus]
MSTQLRSSDEPNASSIGHVLRAPLRRETYLNVCYLVLMFPLGILYFDVLVVGFATGIPLLVLGVGVPLLLAVFVIAVEAAHLERRLVGALLGVHIPVPDPKTSGSRWVRSKRLVTARETWKAIAYVLSEFVYGSLLFGVLASGAATAASFILAPLYYTRAPIVAYGPIPTTDVALDVLFGWDSLLVGLTTTFTLGSWRIETLPGALLVSGLGIVLLWGLLVLADVAAGLWGRYARRMLTTPRYWTRPGR